MIAATPIQIGRKTIKNRITFAPTVKFDFTDDTGLVTQKHIDHYTERAAGGTGLICVEADSSASREADSGKIIWDYGVMNRPKGIRRSWKAATVTEQRSSSS